MEMSRLTRDGTAEPVSRDQILRHARGQGNIIFPVQLTTSRIGNLTRLIHTLLYVLTIHTYMIQYWVWDRIHVECETKIWQGGVFFYSCSHVLTFCITCDDFVGWAAHQTIFSVACNTESEILTALHTVETEVRAQRHRLDADKFPEVSVGWSVRKSGYISGTMKNWFLILCKTKC